MYSIIDFYKDKECKNTKRHLHVHVHVQCMYYQEHMSTAEQWDGGLSSVFTFCIYEVSQISLYGIALCTGGGGLHAVCVGRNAYSLRLHYSRMPPPSPLTYTPARPPGT